LNTPKQIGFQDIITEVRRRVANREWPPGDLIPNEEDIATEFGCARSTVNRALRDLAASGLLERRRKAGTRVVMNPVRKATLSIPITREEIENRGLEYRYLLLLRELATPPLVLCKSWGIGTDSKMLHLKSLHLGNAKPFAYEDRWINPNHSPQALNVDFETNNANEWLVQNAPYSRGDIAFFASNAPQEVAEYLGVSPDTAVFVINRTTWNKDTPITYVKLHYAPGYQLYTNL